MPPRSQVKNKNFVSISEIAELAISEFKSGFETYQECQKMREEIDDLKYRLDIIQKSKKRK